MTMACFIGYTGLNANYILPLKGTKLISMKKLASLLVLLLAGIVLYGQGIVGTWEGSFTTQAPDGTDVTLRVVFHIEATDDGFTSTLDSPDQNALGLPTTETTFESKKLVVKKDDLDFVYTGKLIDDKNIEGGFTQMGGEMAMNLVKKEE
jgi:hypothetical protein